MWTCSVLIMRQVLYRCARVASCPTRHVLGAIRHSIVGWRSPIQLVDMIPRKVPTEYFCSTIFPITSTRWVQSNKYRAWHCLLSISSLLSINLDNIKFWGGTPGFKPKRREARKLSTVPCGPPTELFSSYFFLFWPSIDSPGSHGAVCASIPFMWRAAFQHVWGTIQPQ